MQLQWKRNGATWSRHSAASGRRWPPRGATPDPLRPGTAEAIREAPAQYRRSRGALKNIEDTSERMRPENTPMLDCAPAHRKPSVSRRAPSRRAASVCQEIYEQTPVN